MSRSNNGIIAVALFVALVCLAASFYSLLVWPFIPLAIPVLSLLDRRLSYGLGVALLGAHLVLWARGDQDYLAIELAALVGFFWGGLLIARFQKGFRNWPGLILGLSVFFFVSFSWILFREGTEAFEAKWEGLAGSIVMPQQVDPEFWKERQPELYEQLVSPVVKSGAASILTMNLVHWIVYALVIWQVILALGSSQIFARRRFWLELGSWRLNEWVLAPLFVAIVLLVVQVDRILSEPMALSVMVSWNLLFLSLFAIMFRGLSLLAYLLPRVSPFLVILLLLSLILLGPSLLVLMGFGDIWFDFRRRIRSNPFSDRS